MKGYIRGDHQSFIEPTEDFFLEALGQGPFYLPRSFVTLRDRFQIYVASKFFAFSMFTPSLFMQNREGFSLYWSMLIAYLKNTGVLGTIVYNYRRDGYPPIHSFTAETPLFGLDYKIHSTSADTQKEMALTKCVGELLERRFLAIPTPKEEAAMISASVDSLGQEKKAFANPFAYHRFLLAQTEKKSLLKFNTSNPILWVRGKNLSTNTSALLPAQITFWKYGYTLQPTEGTIHEPTTSGCAGYPTKTGAIVRAIKEQIQRDGFLCYWLTKTSPQSITLESIPDATAQSLLGEFKKYKFDVHVLNTTTDIGLPSITVVTIDRAAKRPRMYATAASHTDCLSAIIDALQEMNSLVGCFEGENEFYLPQDFKPFFTPFGRRERMRYLHGEEMLQKVKWFLDGEKRSFPTFASSFYSEPTNDKAALKHILALLKDRGEGYEAYVYEAKSPILKALRYHAVRAVVPKLISMYLSEHLATLDSKRLYEFAAWKEVTYSPEKLLQGSVPPHPFP